MVFDYEGNGDVGLDVEDIVFGVWKFGVCLYVVVEVDYIDFVEFFSYCFVEIIEGLVVDKGVVGDEG